MKEKIQIKLNKENREGRSQIVDHIFEYFILLRESSTTVKLEKLLTNVPLLRFLKTPSHLNMNKNKDCGHFMYRIIIR